MEAVLHVAVGYVAFGLDAAAVLMVAIGGIDAFVRIFLVIVHRHARGVQYRAIFIEFARWLVAALTFQLGSDIVNTTISPGWDDLGRLAATAGIRTFLTYFLDRDLEKAREAQHERQREGAEGERHVEPT
ncbi:DUF1622 domain-containing protein [Noviherbaspirillum cavernae]|uniref:DUF1622 domain-containing protein n=1 Tax=Noviherbaspirillum cavernae TaxID=2320862 RepID=A0A418X065_9BURK|nr:DUF1622 domain-containing protein [Noviherbaspirillum cavernae]RJG05715.1 DUF1622 domain-containing protein [Noviherbaspirillum cavernae]